MTLFISNKNETVRLFKNPVIEYFTHMHPIQPLILFSPVVIFFAFRAFATLPFTEVILSYLAGILFWIFMEYGLHRFFFHHKAKSAYGKRMVFMLHGCHHDYPKDKTRLVMSPLVSIPLALFFFYFFRFLFGPWQPALFSGLVSGYLAYDYIHYATHHFSMKGKILGRLKANHLRHHFQDPDHLFGLSNPLGDYLFGTYSKPAAIPPQEGGEIKVSTSEYA